MRYFIGFTLPKREREIHKREMKMISDRFGTDPLYERSPSHITLRPPFEFEDIDGLINELRLFCQIQKKGNIKIDGYFFSENTATIMWKAIPDEASTLFVKNLTDFLNTIPKIPKDELGNRAEVLHASVARRLSLEQFREVKEYLQTLPLPRYEFELNAISIYKKVDSVWQELAVFPLAQ